MAKIMKGLRSKYIVFFFLFMIVFKCISFNHAMDDGRFGIVGMAFSTILLFLYIILVILRVRGDSMAFYKHMLITTCIIEFAFLAPKYIMASDLGVLELSGGYHYICEVAFTLSVCFVLVGEFLYIRSLESDMRVLSRKDR